MDDPTTERGFDSQFAWVIDVLGLFVTCDICVIHGCFCNQALADVRSTDAGIKCLYCTSATGTTKKPSKQLLLQ